MTSTTVDVAKRPALVREALTRAAREDGYLGADVACEAIAAAAVVAAQLPGGQPITSPYAPDFSATAAASICPTTWRCWQ